jgi:DNA polymerase-3 subunit epsilon
MGPVNPASSIAATGDVTSYLALLDKVLEDRLVSADEADALMGVANDWGLSGEEVCSAHRTYLGELAHAALADGVVTEFERRDLLEVARLLGFDSRTLDSVLAAARCCSDSPRELTESAQRLESSLAGKSVCFTGALTCKIKGTPISRETAQQLAFQAGMVIADNVTKSLEILVVADPYSLSGKAQKARKYGTRIMAESVFWQTLGVKVD